MMDAIASPLVLTKLHVPARRLSLIPRARLVDLLALESSKGFILVSAPAGYGKTTLLAEWAQSRLNHGTAVAWYALDPSDDDPIPFGAYLVASLTQALGPISDLAHIAQLLRASPEIDLQRILQTVINAVMSSGQDCVLILDDYHLIASPAIHSGLAYLLEHLPENLRIAIGSRSDPPLPLARLRARGQLLEIRAADLRFTASETSLFLNKIMHLEISPEMAAVLETRTEGWVAGLQLAALSLSGRSDKEDFIASFTGSHRYLVEYLLDEVVSRQPEDVQAFLLSTSILERMCAPLCDALLDAASVNGTSPSEAILEQLDQANLFMVPLDSRGYWYRYHHLFRDFLQTRLVKTQPGRVNWLHRAASEWLAAHDFLREAAQHAFQTQDWDYAAAFVERHGFTMIVHSEISTLYEWCSTFPEEVMRLHPMLCIHQCWAWVFSFRRQHHPKIEARLAQAERAAAALGDGQESRAIRESATVVRAFLAMAPDPAADPQKQLYLAQSALETYPQEDAGQFSSLLTIGYAYLALHEAEAATKAIEMARQIALRERLFFGVVESTFHLARLAHNQGRLRYAAELCTQGQADIAAMLVHPERELPAVGCLDIALGCVFLEQNRLDEAEQHLLHGLNLIGMGMNPNYLMTACVGLYRLRDIQGRPAEALDYLTRLEEIWPDIAFCTDALRVVHALRTTPDDPQTLQEATSWCQGFSSSIGEDVTPPGMGPMGAADVYYLANLAWMRVQIATGNTQAVWSKLERQLDLAGMHGLTTRVIELSLLEAQAGRVAGEPQRTWPALERALVAAQPEGFMRIFDQGAALNQLLIEATKRSDSREYVARVLAETGIYTAPVSEGKRNVALPNPTADSAQAYNLESGEHLSERELEVLRLIALGDSNQAIADRLVITVGTVKSHVNHILVKLDVHNRTEAVARARGLGWLEI